MKDIRRGEVWWVELPTPPRGSEPGFRRPVVVVQDDIFNRSRLSTVIVVAVTKNLELADLPGNVLLTRRESGLRFESVANSTALLAIDRVFFSDPGRPLGRLRPSSRRALDAGLRLVLGV